jgi:predicted TIM-barrel fold metal-dependent hydrolase
MTFAMAQQSMVEWLLSGVLARYPLMKKAYSESQIGWMPFILERLDSVFHHPTYAELPDVITRPPSTYVPGRVFGCFFDDDTGVANRDRIGIEQIVFEIDYPHQDSTWPNTHLVVDRIAAQVSPAELERILRTNAIDMLGLDPRPLMPA